MSKKKKILVLLLCAALITVFTITAFSLNWEPIFILRNSITLFIDGTKLTGVSLFEHEGTTYVPIRSVAEQLGYDVTYDPIAQRGYINSKNKGTTSSTTTKVNIMLTMLYKEAQLQLIAMLVPTSGASNTAMTQAYMGDHEGAYAYFRDVSNDSLAKCNQILTDLTDKYLEILKKYKLENNSAYKTKYEAFRTTLNQIKDQTKSFSNATLYFLQHGIKNNDNTAYADYQKALVILMDSLTDNATKFQNEANKLAGEVVGSDYSIMTK